jgi:hypothetical protein
MWFTGRVNTFSSAGYAKGKKEVDRWFVMGPVCMLNFITVLDLRFSEYVFCGRNEKRNNLFKSKFQAAVIFQTT